MTHLRPEARAQRHKRSDCRKDIHNYGEEQNIGAGILRRVCSTCGDVSIDLTYADELKQPLQRNQANILSMTKRSEPS